MTIISTIGGFMVSSFTTRPILSQGPDETRLMRRDPEAVIFNLLNRADAAEREGNEVEAEALRAKAETLFLLV